MTTFAAVARDYATAVKAGVATNLSNTHLGAQLVALGLLGGLTRKEINSEARKAGDYSDDGWKVAKVALSRAWVALGSEDGLGETVARQWAAGDFTISLAQAYAVTRPAPKVPDNLTKAIKVVMALSAEELEIVLKRVQELRDEVTKVEDARRAKAAALMASVA